MRLVAELLTSADPARVHAEIADLTRYPSWAGPVRSVRLEPGESKSDHPAYLVELGARLGPWRRSKRLRMVRTVCEPSRVVFERHEVDGRDHSAWVLTADVSPQPTGTLLAMSFDYGGSLWVPLLDRLAAEAIDASRTRLRTILEPAT